MYRNKLPALTLLLMVLAPFPAFAATPQSATEDEKRAAQKMFEAGDGLYESGRFEDAVAAFKTSYALVSSPNSRLMLARSLRESGRSVDACVEFRGTISDAQASGGRYPEALQAAQSELQALENKLANESPKPSSEPVAAEAPMEQKAAAHPAQPPPAPVPSGPERPQSSPLPTLGWVSAGVGVAGLATFGVFGYLNRKTYTDLEADCANGGCPTSSSEKVDAGRRYQTVATVGLCFAAAGAAAATTLFVLAPRQQPARPEARLRATATGLVIDGSF